MSGDRIEAQKSQGYNNNPQGSVSQQFGDRTEANTGGGDVAQRDIDKRNITINIITGSSSTKSQSHLTAEVSKILGGGIDLDAAIASAYLSALPTDASLHPVQAVDKISELADRRVLHKLLKFLLTIALCRSQLVRSCRKLLVRQMAKQIAIALTLQAKKD